VGSIVLCFVVFRGHDWRDGVFFDHARRVGEFGLAGGFKDYQRKIIWACAIIVVVGWLLRFVEINGYPPLQLLARGLEFTSK
jgi:hypothetical protein